MPNLRFFVLLCAAAQSVSLLGQVQPPETASAAVTIPPAQSGAPSTPQAAPVPAPAPAGRVFAVTGEWTKENGQPLLLGSPVSPGEKIAVKSAGKSTVSIILTSGAVFERTCPGAPDCTSLQVPTPKSAISDNFERILNGSEKIPANVKFTALGGETTPVPAVLMTDNKLLYFGPVVADLPNGYYDLQFIRLKDGVLDTAPEAKVQFSWTPKDPPTDTVPKMENGIYRFTILRNNRTAAPSVDVLVLDRREYTRLRPYFEEARQISNSWNLSDASIRAFQIFSLYGINANRRQ